MTFDGQTIGTIFSIGIILIQIDILVILLALLWKKDGKIISFVRSHAMWLVLFASAAAWFGSLIYSEFLGYAPCKLCWFQRIFIYPQAIIAIIALYTKDTKALKYILALSIIGIFLSINHYFLQMTGSSLLPCSAIGQNESCGGTYTKRFGYITIPLMCATLFAYSIVASSIGLFVKGKNNTKSDE